MRLFHKVFGALRAQHQYFTQGKYEIAKENLSTMQIAGSVGTAVCLVFFFIAPVIIPDWKITIEYYFVLPILIAAFAFSFIYSRCKTNPNTHLVSVASAVFYILLLADFIALSVFPYPDTPQIFISLCFMFMPALLIQRPAVLLGIMVSAETVFIILAANYKTTFSLQNDVFNTIAAFLFSLVIMGTTNRLRCRNYSSRATLQKLSQTDALTGLMNKVTFEKLCAEYIISHEASVGCALMVLDIDNFKQINDKYGHPFGDSLLQSAGALIMGCFRQTDFVGRIGGDEFAVLLRGATSATLIKQKCKELYAGLDAIVVEGVELHTTCSAGVVINTTYNTSYPELFRIADEVLYKVKRENKGFYEIEII